jgi:hypothetical protein
MDSDAVRRWRWSRFRRARRHCGHRLTRHGRCGRLGRFALAQAEHRDLVVGQTQIGQREWHEPAGCRRVLGRCRFGGRCFRLGQLERFRLRAGADVVGGQQFQVDRIGLNGGRFAFAAEAEQGNLFVGQAEVVEREGRYVLAGHAHRRFEGVERGDRLVLVVLGVHVDHLVAVADFDTGLVQALADLFDPLGLLLGVVHSGHDIGDVDEALFAPKGDQPVHHQVAAHHLFGHGVRAGREWFRRANTVPVDVAAACQAGQFLFGEAKARALFLAEVQPQLADLLVREAEVGEREWLEVAGTGQRIIARGFSGFFAEGCGGFEVVEVEVVRISRRHCRISGLGRRVEGRGGGFEVVEVEVQRIG